MDGAASATGAGAVDATGAELDTVLQANSPRERINVETCMIITLILPRMYEFDVMFQIGFKL